MKYKEEIYLQGWCDGKKESLEKELKFLKKLRFDKIWDLAWPDVKKRIKYLERKISA